MKNKLLSIVTPCYNEEESISELITRIMQVIDKLPKYNFEIIVIDNSSTDNTLNVLKNYSSKDKRIKVIVNTRNFGHIRSPYYGILASSGEATIYLASDLQDPPEKIPEFIKWWEQGYKLVLGVKPNTKSSFFLHNIRKIYYRTLENISETPLLNDATGFGLYDKTVLDQIRKINDPYPYLRGLVCELGYDIKTVEFVQDIRKRGITKNNIYTLFDIGMLGLVNHSKVPLRLASFFGILIGFFSILTAIVYFILKMIYWDLFSIGIAPLIIGIFFLIGIFMIILGVLGEYVISIHRYLQKRPVVVEKERINFD
jgi:glycosyltransferase involved in cell wall biosynthesis